PCVCFCPLALTSLSLPPASFFIYICVCVCVCEIQTAKSGQDVSLECQAPNSKSLTGVEWRRNDLKPEDILLYRDERFVSENQHPSFKNRVDLQDRQMKDGNVSVIVKNVTINDTGIYTCRALTPGTKRGKRAAETVRIIDLRVAPPPGEAASWLLMFVSKDVVDETLRLAKVHPDLKEKLANHLLLLIQLRVAGRVGLHPRCN
uniref:Ig-like domain-containing protein n=1 Tax=Amphilophus citrinellus TaxID=61819 RepID=A0A3Q0R8Z2_AMPCI